MEILGDFTTTMRKALSEIEPNYLKYKGLVICGSHSPVIEEIKVLLLKIKLARESDVPFLGICYGHQLAAIEYARNVLGIADATSEEFGKGTFIVKKRSDLKVGLHEGETYWSNYDVDPDFNWSKSPNFITVPFHPEYQSSKLKPHPILKEFIQLCKKK